MLSSGIVAIPNTELYVGTHQLRKEYSNISLIPNTIHLLIRLITFVLTGMLARVTAQNRAEDKRLHAGKSLDADSVFGVVKSENGKGDENNDNKPE